MTETDNDETSMAECGNCRAVIPSDSTECPECEIKFSGISEDALGECGACGFLVPLESTSCSSCGVIFVADDVMDVLRKWLSNTGLNIKSLFDKFDTNGDGMIDSDELRKGLLGLNLADLPPSQVERLIEQIDVDGDGKIDLAELEKSVTGSDYVPSKNDAEEETEEDSGDDESDKEDEVEEEDSGDDDSDEDDAEEDDDSDEEDAEEDDDSDEEDAEEESDEEDAEEDEVVEILPDDIIKLLIDAMDRDDTNPASIFHTLDEDGDKFITAEELSNTINDVLEGEEIAETSISDFIGTLDADSDGNIDIVEFITAIENEIGLDSMDDEEEEKIPKEFPSAIQSSMMSKKWNDVWWPLIHAAFFIFILAWAVNGFIGPVDGSGGSVELDSHHQMGLDNGAIKEGDIYPCDSDVQADGCANSLTPFSGENGASSMPKGFYTDGIIFILLGAIGMGGSLFTHLVLAKGWRARVKAMKEVESDTEDAKEASESEDEEESDSEEEADDEEATDDDDQVEEESDDETEEDSEDDDGSDEDDDIDIGSHVGLTVEDEDFFGVIIEFDDEDGLVTIKEDGSGDEITGYQDEMFLE